MIEGRLRLAGSGIQEQFYLPDPIDFFCWTKMINDDKVLTEIIPYAPPPPGPGIFVLRKEKIKQNQCLHLLT